MDPPPGTDELFNTHIRKGTIRQLSIPLVLNLCDLARGFVIENVDFAVDGLFLIDAFDDIASTKIHSDRVTA